MPVSGASGLWCYGPEAMRKAYDFFGLIKTGYDGTVRPSCDHRRFGSPTLASDLGPSMPSSACLRRRRSRKSTCRAARHSTTPTTSWAGQEDSLDVQWAHAIAPGAKIIVVAAVDNSDAAILAAQNYAIDNKLGFIISESFGESELALLQDGAEGQQILSDNETSYRRAADQNITVLVSSGDDGSEGTDINGDFQLFPVANYPASSPNVTTVGGTNLFFGTATNADPNGTYQGEVVWNDGFGAGGGGISAFFKTPGLPGLHQEQGQRQGEVPHLSRRCLQRGRENGRHRFPRVPRYRLRAGNNGFYVFGGTSASAPQWAGVIAIANQKAGRPLGFLNKTSTSSERRDARQRDERCHGG